MDTPGFETFNLNVYSYPIACGSRFQGYSNGQRPHGGGRLEDDIYFDSQIEGTPSVWAGGAGWRAHLEWAFGTDRLSV